MAYIDFSGSGDDYSSALQREHNLQGTGADASTPPPAPTPATSTPDFATQSTPARPMGGRDDTGAYVPNQPLPGSSDTYWDGDQQLPIPHGTTTGGSTGPSATTNGGSTGGNEQAIRDQYQKIFGRQPTASELSTDLYAASRYGLTNPNGLTGGVLGQIAARGNNTAGSGVTGNPFAGWTNPNDPRTGAPRPVGSGATPAAAATRGTAPAFTNSSPIFSDPATSLIENYALDQYGRRINPDPNSATGLYEAYARKLLDTLQQPVYSPQDEAVLKTKATDAIMAERDATKQRWIEELSARGIAPSSGIALDGLKQIDNHFEGLRTSAEAQFAADAIALTRANRLQALDTAGQFAQEQEGRLQDAGNYVRVPYDLQNQAFARNLQLVGAGGSASDLASTAMSKAQLAIQQYQTQLAANAYSSENKQALTAALLQYLGYLFG